MANENVAQAIFNTIDTIVNKSIKEAGYDKTVLAKVISCSNPATGEHRLKYEGAIISAYSTNGTLYAPDIMVYVTIPANDSTMEKQIIGARTDIKTASLVALEEQNFQRIGEKAFYQAESLYLHAYTKENSQSQKLYQLDSNNTKISVNQNALAFSFTTADTIVIKFKLRTLLPDNTLYGDYRFKFTFELNDDKNKTQTLEYTINDIVGQPYLLINLTEQFKAYAGINAKNLTLKQIEFISTEFAVNTNNAFELVDFDMYGANQVLAQNTGSEIIVNAVNGFGFNNKDQLKFNAQYKYQNVEITSDVEYKWFKRNTKIASTTDKEWDIAGGLGWELLKNIDDTYIIKNNSLTLISEGANSTYAQEYKCVAIYKGKQTYKSFTVYKYLSTSSGNDSGSVPSIPPLTENGIWITREENILTCNVSGYAAHAYSWYGLDSYGSQQALGANKTIDISDLSIQVNQVQIICEVYGENDIYYGYATYDLFKTPDEASVVLSAPEQVFKATQANNGISYVPESITITATTFNLSDNTTFVWWYSYDDINWKQIDDNNTNTLVINAADYFNNDKTYISIRVSANDPSLLGAKEDIIRLNKLTDSNAVFDVRLSNSVEVLNANASGVLPEGTNIITTVYAYKGTENQSVTIGKINDNYWNSSSEINGDGSVTLTFTPQKDNLGSTTSTQGIITIPVTAPIAINLSLSWSKINDARGIGRVEEQYGVSQSETEPPAENSAEWSTDIGNVGFGEDEYLWNREAIIYQNGDVDYSTPQLLCSWGDTGGRGIDKIEEWYLLTERTNIEQAPYKSLEGWSTTRPSVTPEKPYLWNYERIYYITGNVYETGVTLIYSYGEDAKSIKLSAEPQFVAFTEEDKDIEIKQVTINAVVQNIQSNNLQWEAQSDSGEVDLSGEGLSRTIDYKREWESVNVKVSDGETGSAFYDVITIAKLEQGKDGIAVVQSNSNIEIATDYDGNIYDGDIVVNNTIQIYQGFEQCNITGITITNSSSEVQSISGNIITVKFTNDSAPNGTINFTVTFENAAGDQTASAEASMSWVKVKAGVDSYTFTLTDWMNTLNADGTGMPYEEETWTTQVIGYKGGVALENTEDKTWFKISSATSDTDLIDEPLIEGDKVTITVPKLISLPDKGTITITVTDGSTAQIFGERTLEYKWVKVKDGEPGSRYKGLILKADSQIYNKSTNQPSSITVTAELNNIAIENVVGGYKWSINGARIDDIGESITLGIGELITGDSFKIDCYIEEKDKTRYSDTLTLLSASNGARVETVSLYHVGGGPNSSAELDCDTPLTPAEDILWSDFQADGWSKEPQAANASNWHVWITQNTIIDGYLKRGKAWTEPALWQRYGMADVTKLNVFNALTDNGKMQGIYYSDDETELYINASYLKSGIIDADTITVKNLTIGNAEGEVIVPNGSILEGALAAGAVTSDKLGEFYQKDQANITASINKVSSNLTSATTYKYTDENGETQEVTLLTQTSNLTQTVNGLSSTVTEVQLTGQANKSFIDQHADRIKNSVQSTSPGGTTSGTAWEITEDNFTIYSINNENSTKVFKVDNSGAQFSGDITIVDGDGNTVFAADRQGNLELTGEIHATSGTLQNLEVKGTLTLGDKATIGGNAGYINVPCLTSTADGAQFSGDITIVDGDGNTVFAADRQGNLIISDKFIAKELNTHPASADGGAQQSYWSISGNNMSYLLGTGIPGDSNTVLTSFSDGSLNFYNGNGGQSISIYKSAGDGYSTQMSVNGFLIAVPPEGSATTIDGTGLYHKSKNTEYTSYGNTLFIENPLLIDSDIQSGNIQNSTIQKSCVVITTDDKDLIQFGVVHSTDTTFTTERCIDCYSNYHIGYKVLKDEGQGYDVYPDAIGSIFNKIKELDPSKQTGIWDAIGTERFQGTTSSSTDKLNIANTFGELKFENGIFSIELADAQDTPSVSNWLKYLNGRILNINQCISGTQSGSYDNTKGDIQTRLGKIEIINGISLTDHISKLKAIMIGANANYTDYTNTNSLSTRIYNIEQSFPVINNNDTSNYTRYLTIAPNSTKASWGALALEEILSNYMGSGLAFYEGESNKITLKPVTPDNDFGGVKAGDNIIVSEKGDGTISVPYASTLTAGVVKVGDNITLNDNAISISQGNIIDALKYTPASTAIATSDKNGLLSSALYKTLETFFGGVTNSTIGNQYQGVYINNGAIASMDYTLEANIPPVGTNGQILRIKDSNPQWDNEVKYTAGNGLNLATENNSFSLKNASTTEIGGVTIGDNITINDGKISIEKSSIIDILGGSKGTSTQPVYLNESGIKVCTYKLEKDVPANAQFTDTWRAVSNNQAGYVPQITGANLMLISSKDSGGAEWVAQDTYTISSLGEGKVQLNKNNSMVGEEVIVVPQDTLDTLNSVWKSGDAINGTLWGQVNSINSTIGTLKGNGGKGNTQTPIYLANNGALVQCDFSVETSVPADAVFTDTYYLYEAGNGLTKTNGTEDKSFIISLKTATNNTIGGIKIGYTSNGKNYPVVLNDNEEAYVNVPWTDTKYSSGTGINVDSSNKINISFNSYGSTDQPIYFNNTNNRFESCTYMLGASIPSPGQEQNLVLSASGGATDWKGIADLETSTQSYYALFNEIPSLPAAGDNSVIGIVNTISNSYIDEAKLKAYDKDILANKYAPLGDYNSLSAIVSGHIITLNNYNDRIAANTTNINALTDALNNDAKILSDLIG